MSQPRCILVSSRKHHRSVSGTERTGAGIMLPEPTPRRDGRTRSETVEVAVGDRAHRRGLVRRFSRSQFPEALPGGTVGTFRIPMANPGIRTSEGPATMKVGSRPFAETQGDNDRRESHRGGENLLSSTNHQAWSGSRPDLSNTSALVRMSIIHGLPASKLRSARPKRRYPLAHRVDKENGRQVLSEA